MYLHFYFNCNVFYSLYDTLIPLYYYLTIIITITFISIVLFYYFMGIVLQRKIQLTTTHHVKQSYVVVVHAFIHQALIPSLWEPQEPKMSWKLSFFLLLNLGAISLWQWSPQHLLVRERLQHFFPEMFCELRSSLIFNILCLLYFTQKNNNILKSVNLLYYFSFQKKLLYLSEL